MYSIGNYSQHPVINYTEKIKNILQNVYTTASYNFRPK